MGGYASILCGYFLKADGVIAECPQVDLLTYRSAKIRLDKLNYYNSKYVNVFDFWKNHIYNNPVT